MKTLPGVISVALAVAAVAVVMAAAQEAPCDNFAQAGCRRLSSFLPIPGGGDSGVLSGENKQGKTSPTSAQIKYDAHKIGSNPDFEFPSCPFVRCQYMRYPNSNTPHEAECTMCQEKALEEWAACVARNPHNVLRTSSYEIFEGDRGAVVPQCAGCVNEFLRGCEAGPKANYGDDRFYSEDVWRMMFGRIYVYNTDPALNRDLENHDDRAAEARATTEVATRQQHLASVGWVTRSTAGTLNALDVDLEDDLFSGRGVEDLVQTHDGGFVDYSANAYAEAHRVMKARAEAGGVEFHAVYGSPRFSDRNHHVERLQAEAAVRATVLEAGHVANVTARLAEVRGAVEARDLSYSELVSAQNWVQMAARLISNSVDMTADVDAWMRVCPSVRSRTKFSFETELGLCRSNGVAACYVGLQVNDNIMARSLQLFELPSCSNDARPTYSTIHQVTSCGAYDVTLVYYCAGSGTAKVERYSNDQNKLRYTVINSAGRPCRTCASCNDGFPDDPQYDSTCY